MTRVGIQDLRLDLDDFLRRAQAGERFVIIDEARPSVSWQLRAQADEDEDVTDLPREVLRKVDRGEARWAGGKPRGSKRSPKIQGLSTAEIVLEDRS